MAEPTYLPAAKQLWYVVRWHDGDLANLRQSQNFASSADADLWAKHLPEGSTHTVQPIYR